MPRTMILEPLSEDTFDENEKDLMKNNYEKIKNLLDDLKYDDKMNLNQLTARLPTVYQQSTNSLPTVYRQSTDSLPTVYRQLTNRLPTG